MSLLINNLGTIIVGAILLVIIVSILYSTLKKSGKNGTGGCGCGCSSCPGSSMCHGKM
ncbi:MAG: FeoB-associated Cys-rich membrane protein [Lachnospiraceae bacterium]|nr:FeoB-associated Cys-rich membrane protein [Lachnospiraceae bacterium]